MIVGWSDISVTMGTATKLLAKKWRQIYNN